VTAPGRYVSGVETRFSSSSTEPVSSNRRTFSATISARRGQCSGEWPAL